MTSAAASPDVLKLEAIRLHLIRNRELPADASVPLSREALRYLIKALEYADAAFAADIETALVGAGAEAIPELVQALSSTNLTQKSTCAMVLVRLGQLSVPAVQAFYVRNAQRHNTGLMWIAEFILDQLGEPLPVSEAALLDWQPAVLEKVG